MKTETLKISRFGESFWVKVDAEEWDKEKATCCIGFSNNCSFTGIIDNDSYKGDFKVGDEVIFNANEVIDIWDDEKNMGLWEYLSKVTKE